MITQPPRMHAGIVCALLAAGLFGASTPLAKALVGEVSPLLLAGLLYAGSGLGLSFWLMGRHLAGRVSGDAALTAKDLPWLAGAVLFGGILGPALLMFGLQYAAAADASLLLNLESVLTAVIAWVVFQENVDRRILLGMATIVLGGVLLSWNPQDGGVSWGSLGIAGACLCWAIDNNLTRVVSSGDPVQIAAIKGAVAGVINVTLALILGASLPSWGPLIGATTIGLFGYGVSLVMFVLALRHLGTARTGAYFSTAPFVGASLSLLFLGESPTLVFWIAGSLMAFGVWLHVSEQHAHAHRHETLEHEHRHRHDEHHQHEHGPGWDGTEPHSHPHRHEPITHAHPHYPDMHHRHRHEPASPNGGKTEP
jgi:drug/metabolite transporter (DMT)-like permease